MQQAILRFSIPSSANNATKKAFANSLESVRKSGGTIVPDWPKAGEFEAYLWFPKTHSKQELAGYRVVSALNRAFSYSYDD
ncbi:hypothetical protein RIF25_12150 [Thermosynechococcaceae cyanobacterium BACA0444]|uniref:Uncharacterized protein n=1 Tax=Pseudocalidococcus azoricus BACA0444 TaxID=2918990 RepID=A0AAE4FSM8_9CYAN|nr:hypothetical protein [Pseudocalidococcus azoricus]MDS3861559.1 hypothetical protein [Pseudocalidococcus azoricus BACA0444]